MPEPNQNPPIEQPTQICLIRIGVPVSDDDEAIAIKRAVAEALVSYNDVNMDFSIRTIPRMPPKV